MKQPKILTLLLIIFALAASYYFYAQKASSKDNESLSANRIAQLKNDPFPFTGTYHWTFYLGPVKQISTHTFAATHIDYQMQGKVHSTNYRMDQLSYDAEQKKWIGKTPEGTVYTLFFKEIEHHQLTIYKHKCKAGLSEAIALQRPDAQTTKNHGWNVYTREGIIEESDILPFTGVFDNVSDHKGQLQLSDKNATWLGQSYEKVTHHAGERRWMGKNEENYLVIFYDHVANNTQINFAIIAVDSIEQAYQPKHPQHTFSTYQKR